MINEEFNKKVSLSEKISQIKLDNPGKFDHLPDPKMVNALDGWSDSEIGDFEKKLKDKFENNEQLIG